jgi:hypothetical protein
VPIIESDNILYNLTNSFYDYLTTAEIKKGLTTKTLLVWYNDPQIQVVGSFPDLTEMETPTLAIDFNSFPASTVHFMGGRKCGDYVFNLWGFAGWTGTHSGDSVQRDKLISDVMGLLEDRIISIYDWDGNTKGSELGYGTILNPAGEKLPETGSSLADKYRFLITGMVRILEKP